MSSYSVPATQPNHEVIVGWDAPLTTFFAQVEEAEIDFEENNQLLLDIGATDREIPTLEHLQAAIAAFATIPENIIEQLQTDYDNPWSPEPAQQINRALIAAMSEQTPPEACSIVGLEPLPFHLVGKSVWVVCDLVRNQWNPHGAKTRGTIIRVVRALNPHFTTVVIDSDDFEKPEPFSLDRQGVLWDITDTAS